MSWGQGQSRRRTELPSNWPTIRAAVLHRDRGTCQLRGSRCTIIATEVDHVGDRHDHRMANLRALCHTCHGTRTARQSHASAAVNRAKMRHRHDRHPGLD